MTVKLWFSKQKADQLVQKVPGEVGYEIVVDQDLNFYQANFITYSDKQPDPRYSDFALVAEVDDIKVLIESDGEFNKDEVEELDQNDIKAPQDVMKRVKHFYKPGSMASTGTDWILNNNPQPR